ncbi:DNA repair exonuclease [Westerdykella ornata]|uniref:Double-strand break repair protein n=1 Tax=Westerdykella ornata TaxID=318751 RepID=A0A6A6JI32_WESOR|nr:DNA repair exonuclease [Westerdykella ornata]KAF2276211.1 DNA repair exonuclease [Westerdykella ornata]
MPPRRQAPSSPEPPPRGPDTIRILIATDSHVGYNERDLHRGDDSWKTFHEVMCLAKEHDVDMVLHGGDLFHENKPSRKSLYHVMRSLRMNCLGDKPCELEMVSDASENFGGYFDHVNYEDPDINVAIPVFAIHGNHDDPSGEGSFSALDILQVSGLVNYYGRHIETDKVSVKPVLLQKGKTKLALYGMSNIRDERLFRNFREGTVKFFQPTAHKDEWFNLMTVHQNHHAYTDTGYLPENFLPEFMDFVVWGHEHECIIDPTFNPEMGFHVMQPGSSVATSLMPGEAVPKHVAILSITGKEWHSQKIRLKSVRPFVMKEIVLAEEEAIKRDKLWLKSENRTKITQHLEGIVEQLIEDAQREWLELQGEDRSDGDIEIPRPLVRLRVEYTAPEPGEFKCENPQRFSNRFVDRVANTTDVVQFYRKKHTAKAALKNNAELPDQSVLNQLSLDSVKVEKLVKEFLEAQSLTILPQNSFGDAVTQFVDKDDKHAMEMFVNESLANQLKHLLETNDVDEEDIVAEMEQYRSKLEQLFASGQLKRNRKRKLKPKPDNWDSDMDGEWADQPGALIHTDAEDNNDDEDLAAIAPKKPAPRGKGKAATETQKKKAPAPRKAAPARGVRGKKKVVEEDEDEDEEDEDVIMVDDDDEEEEEEEETLFVKPTKTTTRKAPARTKSPPKRAAGRTAAKQTTLNFSQTSTRRSQAPARAAKSKRVQEPPEQSDDEISDDDDAFEPVSAQRSRRR